MKVNVRTEGAVTLIDLNGKITIGEGDVILRDAIEKALKGGATKLLLNLSKISYMKLLNPSGKVEDLLQLTKLEEIFETFRDEATALKSF